MLDALALLTIEIGIDPEIGEFGGLLLTWHGVFTALGIAGGVLLGVFIGRRLGFTEDDVYSIALVSIPCGIIGARALFVIERWGDIVDDPVDIFRINEGGIAVYGAIIGGVIGGVIYCWIRKLPVRRAIDGAACGLLLGLAIGRIGDLINGEHFAELSGLPWAVRYTNLNSPSVLSHPIPSCSPASSAPEALHNLCTQHPAVAYDMLGSLVILGVVLLVLRYARREGVAFFTFLLLYSLLRLGESELRLDSREIVWGLTTPQVTALCLIPVAILGIVVCWRIGSPEREAPVSPARPVPAPAGGGPAG
ncbi:MAG: prolipoprotein diacylglyceryl transferase family protein [Dehalococcoidia bacterium]